MWSEDRRLAIGSDHVGLIVISRRAASVEQWTQKPMSGFRRERQEREGTWLWVILPSSCAAKRNEEIAKEPEGDMSVKQRFRGFHHLVLIYLFLTFHF